MNTTITTTENYDDDYATAETLIAERVDLEDWQFRHNVNDMLNNEWIEGITIAEWVERVLRRLGV